MNWKKLFSPTGNLNPSEGRELLNRRPPGEVQLLDVRQPKEYEAGHIPGARLIPLKELPDRLAELQPEKPLLVYCAVGGRSRAAAQFLNGQGFREVYNLAGGIRAWQGERATGPAEAGLELLPAGAEYEEAAALAWAMEAGLQRFYLRLAEQAADVEWRALYQRLAGWEEGHKARLLREYQRKTGQTTMPAAGQELLEGGTAPDDPVLAAAFQTAATPAAVLEQAMGLEMQALDLYLRLADRQPEDAAGRALFLTLAAEEKEHLALLAAEFDRHNGR